MSDETPKNGGNDNTDPKKIEFTPEQQEKVNELIDKAVGKTANKVRTELTEKITSLQSELEAAKEAAKNAKGAANKADANADVAALQAKIDEMKEASKSSTNEITRWKTEAQTAAQKAEAARAEADAVRKDVAITGAASKVNFVNLDVVLKLTKDQIQKDPESGRWQVLNEAGQPRLNAAMEPMSLEEFYNDFAAKNKYLVRGDVTTGAGSSESTMRATLSSNGKYELKDLFGPKSNSRLANELAKENPAEYKRLRVLAKSSGLIN